MYWHLIIASARRLALFPSDADRRAAANTIARVGRDQVLLFCVADDHVHALVAAERARAVRLGVNLSLALQPRSASELAAAHVGDVHNRRHLQSLVKYVLDQTSHHVLRTAQHPALWPGSAFPALIGARLQPGFDRAPLIEALPRITDAELFAAARLPVVAPCSDDALSGLGVDRLARCVAEAFGQERLDERRANGGRAILARLALGFGVGAQRIAQVLETSDRQVRRLAAQDPDPRVDHALRLWVAIREAATASAWIPDAGQAGAHGIAPDLPGAVVSPPRTG